MENINSDDDVDVNIDIKLNSIGFNESSFNDKDHAAVIPKNIRKEILSAIPKDYAKSWHYYRNDFLFFFGYLAVFMTSIYFQNLFSKQYYNANFLSQFTLNYYNDTHYVSKIVNRTILLLLFPVWAWSFLGIMLCGHCAIHNAFSPKKTAIGNIMNKCVAFVSMDLLIMSSWVWNKNHLNHHKNVGIRGVDDMYLRGNNIFSEQLYCLSIPLRYWFYDICELFNVSSCFWMRKFRILFGFIFRFYFIFYVFMNYGDLFLIFGNLIWLILLLNYIGLLAHSLPVTTKGKTKDYFLQTMRESWDIWPASSWMNFVHAGNGGHCTHHIFPYLPRSLYYICYEQMTKHCPDEYRVVDTFKKEWWLFRNRRSTM